MEYYGSQMVFLVSRGCGHRRGFDPHTCNFALRIIRSLSFCFSFCELRGGLDYSVRAPRPTLKWPLKLQVRSRMRILRSEVTPRTAPRYL
jgi:hypothetical protein